MKSVPLPWLEPRSLARVLAARFGQDGLVLLDGDGSRLGSRGVLGVDPVARVVCRGLPGTPGAGDPFAVLADLERQGGRGWAGSVTRPGPGWSLPTTGSSPTWPACGRPATTP